ncbi:MAG: 50S ribosomal protein L3 [Omnitrophica WOR_2 bacterium GWA2_47_8]|nr:MAG: 50S ribosomal protein L3 [Omnitrophica WOR_2 bacterium GWA2_47_8]
MIQGMLGRKIGMTQIFDKDGNTVAVTAVETGPCVVLGLIEAPYKRVKLGFEPVKESRVSKPRLGFFKKAGVVPMRFIREFGLKETVGKKAQKPEEAPKTDELKVGQKIKADLFRAGDFVTVSGFSIGKGFQGGMKRYHWMGGGASHGSMHHRRVGSIGSNTTPGRVNKGKHMPGHMGDAKVSVENLRVMAVDVEKNLILVNGAVPGKKNSFLTITFSRKKAFKSFDEVKVVHAIKRNPMKQSKASTGKK